MNLGCAHGEGVNVKFRILIKSDYYAVLTLGKMYFSHENRGGFNVEFKRNAVKRETNPS